MFYIEMNSEEICKKAVANGEYENMGECMDKVHGVRMGGKRRRSTKHKSHKRKHHTQKRHTRKRTHRKRTHRKH
jgi:hypothetical protein